MHKTSITYADERPPKKKPLDPHLFAGEHEGVDAVRVRTGYPIWNLVAQWIGANYQDDAVLAAYSDMPREEWEAAKQYYLDHRVIFDARIIHNSQPYADEETPPHRTLEDYFAWYAQVGKDDAQEK